MPNPFCGWCLYEQRCSVRSECLRRVIQSPTSSLYYYPDDPSGTTSQTDPSNLIDSVWLSTTNSDSSSSFMRCPSIRSVSPSRFVNPTSGGQFMSSTTSSTTSTAEYTLDLNVRLIPAIDYFCDVTSSLFSQRSTLSSSTTTASTRVRAVQVDGFKLKCDLSTLKAKFEQITRTSPIRTRFANVTLQIRASVNSLQRSVINLIHFKSGFLIGLLETAIKQLFSFSKDFIIKPKSNTKT